MAIQQIDYSAVLEDLKSRRDALNVAMSAIQAILDGSLSSSQNTPSPRPHAVQDNLLQPREGNLAELVIAGLNKKRGHDFSIAEIANEIGLTGDLKSLRGTLSRLTRERRIRKIARGKYRALGGPISMSPDDADHSDDDNH